MRIVEYKVEIAAFDPESIPDKDTVEAALEECVENIETNGGNVTVRAALVCDATFEPVKSGEKNEKGDKSAKAQKE